MLTPKSTLALPAALAAWRIATLPHYGGNRPGAHDGHGWEGEGGVHFGITMIPTDYAVSPVRLGAMVEAHGFESLWLGEHSHIPVSRESAYPSGGSCPPSLPTSTTPW